MFIDEKREGETTISPLRGIYLYAITILETHGWVQEEFHSENGAYCIVGALAKAAAISNLEAEVNNTLLNPIREIIETYGVTECNDYCETEYEDVISVLKQAAERS